MTTPKLTTAPFAREESRLANESEWKAGIRLAEMAFDGDERVDSLQIEEGKNETHIFYPWYRIKMPGMSVRAIVEVRGDKMEVVVIAVMPRSIIYDDLRELWERRRTPRSST